jgi:hypothetical protein
VNKRDAGVLLRQRGGVANIDLQNRAPTVTRTPDFRERVERRYDVLNNVPKSPADILAICWKALGTVDEEYTNCYLVEQRVEGQTGDSRNPCKDPPVLVRVFEQLDGFNETLIGQPSVVMDQYGNQSAIFTYWQLNVGTSTYQVPGVTVAPVPFNACVLKTEERTNDGTLRKITRTYINRGELSDTEQLKFNGKLLLRELTYLNQIPPTPAGWTLTTQSTEFIAGLPVYRYGFTNGSSGAGAGGVISTDITYNRSPDEGVTGITVTTIKQISAPTIVSNPITGPGGAVLIEVEYDDQDGYRLWTAKYASGTGVVSSEVETKDNGNLVVYTKIAINAAPPAPSPTIGGTVNLVRAEISNGTHTEDGVVVYTYVWAEGNGTISTSVEEKEGGNLVIYRTIALGTAPSAPAPTIGGTVIATSQNVREEDGYTLYDYTWAEGNGTISTSVEEKEGGNLVIYRTIALGTAPSAPAPTIGGTVIATSQNVREEDGYTLYDYTWAEGKGTISSEVETKNGGQLILYSITALGTAPSTPSATIGGTVTLVDALTREEDGYTLYSYKWAEGKGEISRETEYRQSVDQGTAGLTVITVRYLDALSVTSNPISTPAGTLLISEGSVKQDGYRLWTATYAKGTGTVSTRVSGREDFSLVYEVTALGAAAATPAYPGSGTAYLTSLVQDVEGGYFINRATYIKPPPSTAFRRQRVFPMPGLAYFVGTDLILQPATEMTLLATETVSYGTAQDTSTPFTVTKWAGFTETYTPTDTGIAINNQFGLNGYLAAGVTISGSGMYKGVDTTAYSATRFASSPTSLPTGSTVIGVMNEPYLIDITGVVVFRSTVTTATLP